MLQDQLVTCSCLPVTISNNLGMGDLAESYAKERSFQRRWLFPWKLLKSRCDLQYDRYLRLGRLYHFIPPTIIDPCPPRGPTVQNYVHISSSGRYFVLCTFIRSLQEVANAPLVFPAIN